jgi:hypothetical protein
MSKSLSRAQRRVIAAVAVGLGLLVAWKLSLAMTFALQGFDPDVATGSADCDQCTLTTALDGIGYLVAGLASYLLLALAIWWKLRRWGGLDSRRRGAHYLRHDSALATLT